MKINRWFSPTIWGIALATTVSVPTLGKIVTADRATSIARQYVDVSEASRREAMRATRASRVAPPYYIYNDRRGRGFVVVAGDDGMGQVLGYSHAGTLDTLRASQELKFLLGAYRDAFLQLQRQPATRAIVGTTPPNRKAVAPMLATAWSQDDPYNRLTGYDYTGCVATAVAQIMRYHRWPERGRGSNSYKVLYDNREMRVDFSQSVYQWDKMLPKYDTYSARRNTVCCNAVALLMRDVGVAVNMQYTPSASGAHTFMAAKALKKYFDYSTSMLSKSDEGTAAFVQILRKEMENGFPVYISGNAMLGGNGHAWVVDGVDKDNLFHMNFGWGGGGDGYFSISALNLSTTGREFGGKPLTFNKQLQIVLVHPNKPNSAPIDTELADDAPNLCFYSEGGISVDGNLPAGKQRSITVSYHHFKNQAGRPFAGDIGLAVYNERNEQVDVVPSAWHDKGGYTAERCKYNGGALGPDQLIEDTCTFKVDLANLADDGRYYLLPVCANIKENGGYGAWCRMKTSPRIAFDFKGGNVRVYEKPDDNAPFALAAHPYTLKPCVPSGNATLCLTIRKLTGTPFDGVVRVSLVDDGGRVVASGQTPGAVDFDMFAETETRVDMRLPDNLQPKDYKLKVEVVKQNANNIVATVGMVHGDEPSMLRVVTPKPGDRLFTRLLGMVKDNSESSMPSMNVDLTDNPLLRIGVAMTLAPQASYNGKLTLCLIDTQNQRRISLGSGAQRQYKLIGGAEETFLTGWLKTRDDLPVINNRTYRLALMGEVDGEERDLWNDNNAPFFLSFVNGRHDVYPGDPTGMDQAKSKLSVVRDNGWICAQGEDLACVQVFALNGTLLASVNAMGQRMVKLRIPTTQMVVVKVRTALGGTFVRKMR